MASKYENERVSVITPVYNAERFIADTVESAANQTYKDIEIVLVDDCSKDRSAEIISMLKNKYSSLLQTGKESGSSCGQEYGPDTCQWPICGFFG